MEKIIGEDDIKELEEEINSAVERLFVEEKRGSEESVLMESPILESPYEIEKNLDLKSSSLLSSEPLSFLKTIEKMENQLLLLEREITKENLEKIKKEIIILYRLYKEKPDIPSVLNFMEKVLNHMIQNEQNIHPGLVKFLLDSKETLKLLMKEEKDSEINIYKQLAYIGLESRFYCLPEFNEIKTERFTFGLSEEKEGTEILKTGSRQIEELLNKMNLFSEKVEDIFKNIDQHLSRLGRTINNPSVQFVERKPLSIHVTIFRVNGNLFGIESNKVFKLFKVPNTFRDKYSNQQKIRLKDSEVRMIDLKKLFSIQSGDQEGEIKILTVKDKGEYKGLIVDQVLKQLSAHLDVEREYGEYFLGIIQWVYQDHLFEIPVLDLKRV